MEKNSTLEIGEYKMVSREIKEQVKSPKKGQSGFPSWDASMREVARIIGEQSMYPEEMPDENFEVSDNISFPSWNGLLVDLARVILDDEMYPEEMPDESFEIY